MHGLKENKRLIAYCEHCSSVEPALATRIRTKTANDPGSHMMVGATVGNLLRILVAARKPVNILEIGSFTGYSASMMLSMLSEGGKLWMSEDDPVRHANLQDTFSEELMSGRVALTSMDGFKWLARTSTVFDLIFLDARKEAYPRQYSLVKDKLAPNGILAVDNTLCNGSVLSPERPWEIAIDEFNHMLSNDLDMIVTLLPIRDGFTVALKRFS